MIASKRLLQAALLAVGLASAVGAVPSQAAGQFTFFKVEFEPRDQRLPLAQAYLARTMVPGTSMAAAEQAARKAGADCGRPDQSGAVSCKASSMRHRSGDDLNDVMWLVRLTPAADGSLASAIVTRTTAGM